MMMGPGLGLLNRRRRAAAAFVGAYDAVPNITAAYGMRRLLTSYTGSLLRMRRSSDNAESDFGYTSAGHLDTAAIVAWLSGSGYIVKWYDQSGNGYDATQSTAASQPLYVASGQNGRPVLRWDGVDDTLALSLSIEQPDTICVVSKYVSGANKTIVRRGTVADSQLLRYDTNSLLMYAGSPSTTAIAAGWHVISAVFNGSSSVLAVNGSSASKSPGASGLNGTVNIGSGQLSEYSNNDIAELIICNAALSTGDRQTGESAAANYWGITLS